MAKNRKAILGHLPEKGTIVGYRNWSMLGPKRSEPSGFNKLGKTALESRPNHLTSVSPY